MLFADSRFPGGGHVHSGGLEEAAARGLVRDEADLPAFLTGRLRTAGALAAVFAAAAAHGGDWAVLEAELDARTPSAAQREASRAQGAATARAAAAMFPPTSHQPPVRDASNSRSTVRYPGGPPPPDPGAGPVPSLPAGADENGDVDLPVDNPGLGVDSSGGERKVRAGIGALLGEVRRPHHAIVLGAAVAAGGGGPRDAALAAAYLSVSGPASAGVRLLGLDPLRVNGIVAALAGVVTEVADRAALTADRAPADLPAPGAPGLDLLSEEHRRHHREQVRLFAS